MLPKSHNILCSEGSVSHYYEPVTHRSDGGNGGGAVRRRPSFCPGQRRAAAGEPALRLSRHLHPGSQSRRAAQCLAGELRALLPPLAARDTALVVGMGNEAMTPDAVGAEALTHLLVTRHMVDAMPRRFGHLRSVAALRTGVLAQTGVETLELIRGAVSHIRPTVVIAVDALAARSRHRLCATVQLSDAGLTPGSGVGNHRKAVDAAALGVPVIALGVPTVIDGAALCGQEDDAPTGLFVTPRDIDSRVRELGRLIGRGLTLALQPGLSAEEVAALLG